jgi:hypothetical protein
MNEKKEEEEEEEEEEEACLSACLPDGLERMPNRAFFTIIIIMMLWLIN